MTSNDELERQAIEKEMDEFENWFLEFHRPDWSRDGFTRMQYANGMGFAPGYMQAVWKGWQARAKQESNHD